ncbi:MAG: hypothetical protein DRR06_20750, partial [Gammaproteobacteria bacterium]
MPSFDVDTPGSYTAALVVNDSKIDSLPDTVTVTTENSAPIAHAGPDQAPFVGDTVSLDGSLSSDVDGDAFTFSWSLTSIPANSNTLLINPATETPSFHIDVPGKYIGQLIVNDSHKDSLPDTVTVTTENTQPIANAGSDQMVPVGATVNLDGSLSEDADGNELSYAWSITTKPLGSQAELSDPGAANPDFNADIPGMYIVQLVVNDGHIDSDPDTAVINTENQAPEAIATASAHIVPIGTLVQLNGSTSSDPDGDVISYQWSLSRPIGSNTTLSATDVANPDFTPDVPGTYQATLVVDDSKLSSAPSVVSITVLVANNPPDMIPAGNRIIPMELIFVTRLFAVDPDTADVLTFSLTTAPNGMTIDADTGDLQWLPTIDQLGSNSITVQVTDMGGLSDTESFSIEVTQPLATPATNAPPQLAPIGDKTQIINTQLTIQANASDADVGDTLTFEFANAPSGMTIGPVSGAINWTPNEPQIGAHDVAVRVTDAIGAVDVGSFIVMVNNINRAPVAVDDIYTARIGETLVVPAPGVLENDSDPDGDTLAAVLQSTTVNGNLVFNTDGSFEYTPEMQQDDFEFGAQMICQPAERRGVEAVPLVIDLDGDGLSEIVFTGGYQTSGASKHHITAMRPDCTILWSYESDGFATPIPNVGTTAYHRQPITAADMDGDGDIEIFILIESDISIERANRYAILDHQGTMIGKTDIIPQISNPHLLISTAPAIADLDGDGDAEFIVAFIQSNLPYLAIFDHNGNLLVVNENAPATANTSNSLGTKPVVVDLDMDGVPEILMTSHVYSNTGAYLRTFPLNESLGAPTVRSNPRAIPAVANFDADPDPEVYFQ